MTKITYTKRFLEEEVNPFHLREACHGHLEALLRAFDWEDTPQGNRHWSDRWCGLSPLDTEELQNMLDQYNSVIKEESADSSGEVCYDFDKMEVDRRYMDPFMTYDPVDKPAQSRSRWCRMYRLHTTSSGARRFHCLLSWEYD